MGGHGGLNILPQKRWNVYNYENREKVRRDEEAAARDEQLRREQSRRRDAEFRLERLRQARGGLPSSSSSPAPAAAAAVASPPSALVAVETPGDSGHINLFDGLSDFSSLAAEDGRKKSRAEAAAEDGGNKNHKRRRREEEPRVVTAEDQKYRLGYGVAGKDVKAPWYLARPSPLEAEAGDGGAEVHGSSGRRSGGKKSIEELREERMRREKREKERERAILAPVPAKKGMERGFSRRGA